MSNLPTLKKPVTPISGKFYYLRTKQIWRTEWTLWSEKFLPEENTNRKKRSRLARINHNDIIFYVEKFHFGSVTYDKLGYKDMFGLVRSDYVEFVEVEDPENP